MHRLPPVDVRPGGQRTPEPERAHAPDAEPRLSSGGLLALQATAGNQAVGALLRRATIAREEGVVSDEGKITARGEDIFLPMQDARQGAERNLMRHHIIPVAALTDFFNAVKENGELDERNVEPQDFRNYDESPSFGDVLHDVTLNAYGSYQYGAMDPKVKEARQEELEGGKMNYELAKKRKWQNWLKFGNRGAMGTFMDPHKAGSEDRDYGPSMPLHLAGVVKPMMSATEEEPLTADEKQMANLIASMYHWMPGNLFEGPKDRGDDPGNGLDVNAVAIIGAAEFEKYRTTYDAIKGYVANDDKRLEHLSTALKGFKQFIGRSSPYPYRASQWILDEAKPKIRPAAVPVAVS